MQNVTFNVGSSGIGTPLPGLDHVSGLLFYSGATLPTGFSTASRVKTFFGLSDAVAAGITNTSLGETPSTATYSVTTKFTVGDVLKITCATIDSTNPLAIISATGVKTLCNYTAVTGDDVSLTTSAAAIKNAINAGTNTHGFTATSAVGVVTITAPAGQGIFLNTGTPYTKTETGAILGTLTQNVVVGVASDIDIMYYHISEFFRINPKGELWVGIYATADIGTFQNVADMQNYSQGRLRQIGVYQKTSAFSLAHCTALEAIYTTLSTNKKPLQIVLNGEISATTDITTLLDTGTLTAKHVSVTIGQDGAAKGFKLWKATGKSIGNLGSTLGAISKSKVNQAISWVGGFNLSNGTEMEVLCMANGDLLSGYTDSKIAAIDGKHYTFNVKVIDVTGSYFNGRWTCVTQTDDYCKIDRGRTMDKSIRSMNFYLTPALGSTISFNPDGTIAAGAIGYYESLCQKGLDDMTAAGELSASKVIINKNQNVLQTGNLVITVQELSTGVAENIIINVGYVTAIV